MKATMTAALALGLSLAMADGLRADSFGSGEDAFTIDFVAVGNADNAPDAGEGGGIHSSPYGGVSYPYRMGVYEISQDAITKATFQGLANETRGAWTGSQPSANISWFQAAAFVNWLNTSTGHHAAYNLVYNGGWSMDLWSSEDAWQAGGENLYRHKDAHYFLPSEDEWYKAAYHQNDGVTENYWDYATGSNTAPDKVVSGTLVGTAVYGGGSVNAPAGVESSGGLSPYGTMGQNGNVREWTESAYTVPNSDPTTEDRVVRGGFFNDSASYLISSFRMNYGPGTVNTFIGFRVASVP